jgi:hypothetical protein
MAEGCWYEQQPYSRRQDSYDLLVKMLSKGFTSHDQCPRPVFGSAFLF